MSQQSDAMLARWPALFPGLTVAEEQDEDRSAEAERIRKEIVAPLLDSDDTQEVFEATILDYKKWRDSLPVEESDPETVLPQEERIDEILTATLNCHRNELGEQAVKATLESVRLRRIARRSTVRNRETWPEESWHRIGDLMASSELCLTGILQYLATGEGSMDKVNELSKLGFQYSLDAYFDSGDHGQDFTRL